MEKKEPFEEKTRTAPSTDSSQPSNGNSANSSSSGNQSSDSSTNQSALQNTSQEDSEEIVLKAGMVQDNYRLEEEDADFLADFPEKKKSFLGSLGLIVGGGIIFVLVAFAFYSKEYLLPNPPESPTVDHSSKVEEKSTQNVDPSLKVEEKSTQNVDPSLKVEEKSTQNTEVESSSKVEEKSTQNTEVDSVESSLKVEEKSTQNTEVDSSSKVEEKSTQNTEIKPSSKVEEKSTQNPKVESKEPDLTQPANLLQQCKQHFDAGRLTMGNEGTALACYKEVLKLESSNAAALAGLQEIKVRYVRGIDTALKYGQYQMVKRLKEILYGPVEGELGGVEKELAEEVDALLKTCRAHFGAGKVEIALTCYRDVLKLDADNDFALDGIKACIEIMVNVRLPACKKHFEANRLTSGIEGNALDCYQKLLKIAPDNIKVLDGLKAIAKRYEEWAYKALRKKQFRKAKGYLPSLEKVDPHSSILADLKRRLKIK